jgi:hypothetical protein
MSNLKNMVRVYFEVAWSRKEEGGGGIKGLWARNWWESGQ